ncbi:MAG: hypothetical protein CMO80_10390 [Verrucomicrobiales bacterium]|nr:hypothetical protein [Verrucomicrobiales bacterium]|tara:strand:- start:583 stop:900 length:318 start_codon:yes stop_codon:yes gene_type:complete
MSDEKPIREFQFELSAIRREGTFEDVPLRKLPLILLKMLRRDWSMALGHALFTPIHLINVIIAHYPCIPTLDYRLQVFETHLFFGPGGKGPAGLPWLFRRFRNSP